MSVCLFAITIPEVIKKKPMGLNKAKRRIVKYEIVWEHKIGDQVKWGRGGNYKVRIEFGNVWDDILVCSVI